MLFRGHRARCLVRGHLSDLSLLALFFTMTRNGLMTTNSDNQFLLTRRKVRTIFGALIAGMLLSRLD